MNDKDIEKQFDKPLNAEICDQINSIFSPYIFYERLGKDPTAGYKCFCTYCRKGFTAGYSSICLDGYTLKHRDKAICPICKHEVTLFHNNRGKKVLTEWRKIVVFRRTDKDHVYVQGFYAVKAYNGAPYESLNKLYHNESWNRDPQIEVSESSRYLFMPGKVRMWKLHWDYIYHEGLYWAEENNPVKEPFGTGFGFENSDYYFVNEKVIDSSFLRYSCWRDYYSKLQSIHIMKYLVYYTQYPVCEMMIKTGLADFVRDAVDYKKPHKRYINWSGSTPTEIFKGITKQEFREMCQGKITAEEYIRYILLCRSGLNISISECIRISRQFTYEAEDLIAIMTRFKISLTKAENYIAKFTKPKDKRSRHSAVILWKDYLETAEKLEYDLADSQVYMPKNLPAAHNAAVNIMNQIKADIEAKEMKKLTEKLIEKYSFEYSDMMIVVPRSIQDIIREGKALSHCVGGYAERHAKGQTTILFLRKKGSPNVPFFTIEIGCNHKTKKPYIVQCHGYKNEMGRTKPQKVIDFEREFGEFIRDPKEYKNKHRRKSA